MHSAGCAKFVAMSAFARQSCLALLLLAASAWADAPPAAPGDEAVLQAREAFDRKNGAALAAARVAANEAQHPLAMWVDYWALGNRLAEARQDELDAFYARWPGTYVEDRLRNDWLLELGRRGDWVNLRAEFPRFRMNDDREVTCYALLARHLDGQDVRDDARAAWLAPREPADGCKLLASTLFQIGQLQAGDAWQAARLAIERNRPGAARDAATLISPAIGKAVAELLDKPERYLSRRGAGGGTHGHELLLLALMRAAASDADFAAAQLSSPTLRQLPAAMEATAWAHLARQAAMQQLPSAADYARRAWQLWDHGRASATPPPWSTDVLTWHVRAALRQPRGDTRRWTLVTRAIDALPAAEQRDSAWVYWKARATQALAAPGPGGETARAAARAELAALAPLGFYGKLAGEELGLPLAQAPAPAALTASEQEAVRQQSGLRRALQLIALGLRSEGVREWNFTLRGLPERELLAAAQWACEREVWDRCINTSERTRIEVDMRQRFPLPYREQVQAQALASGLEPALLFGLIRQESRFVADIRSNVGAAGLMQLMPATARWTARKVGLTFRPGMVTDTQINLQLGAAYLKRVLDDFDGSRVLATAAYNAGPNRSRRWREGPTIEAAAWVENIPFNETRDYVKKVLSNQVDYAARLGGPVPTLKSLLGGPIGPRPAGAASPDRELP